VPEEIIVAVIGIETMFGRLSGSHRTLDVLMTLSFDYTRRAAYYREELAQFLLLCREQRLDPWHNAARSPARSACRNSCPARCAPRRSISMATAASTSRAAPPMRSDRWRFLSSTAGRAGSRWRSAPDRCRGSRSPGRDHSRDLSLAGRGAPGRHIDGTLDPDTRVLLADLPFVSASASKGSNPRRHGEFFCPAALQPQLLLCHVGGRVCADAQGARRVECGEDAEKRQYLLSFRAQRGISARQRLRSLAFGSG